jgi:DNA-binding NtrC family response regulator
MDRPRVLVVEDRPSIRKLLVTVLEGGHEVTTAQSGAEALELLGAAPVDVVLTDVRMPGGSGFDVLRAAREKAPGAAVVLMTAYATVPDAVAAMKLGAFDYVAKPLDADELALVVARAVQHRREAQGAGPLAPPPAPAPGDGDVTRPFHEAVEAARDDASRRYLVSLMRAFRGNVTQAALRAGMTRESLHRVLRKYGIHSEDHKPPPGRGEADEAEE